MQIRVLLLFVMSLSMTTECVFDCIRFLPGKSLLPVHVEQKQDADGTWQIQKYDKYPIGSYDRYSRKKKDMKEIAIIGLGIAITSFGIFCMRHGKRSSASLEADIERGAVLAGLTVAAMGGICWAFDRELLLSYVKDYVPTNNSGNPLQESCEYYKWFDVRGCKEMPMPIMPTSVVKPFEKDTK